MIANFKKVLKKTRNLLALGYNIGQLSDYQTLNQYILKINQQRDIDGILREVSKCMKELLDYELLGFVLKNEETLDIWVDPDVHILPFVGYVKDFGGQNFDHRVHRLNWESGQKRHNFDRFDVSQLISRDIAGVNARLYVLPRRKMLKYHDTIITAVVSCLGTALEKHLCIQQLENAAAIDPLTNCYNRRALDRLLESSIAYARRCCTDLSLVMMDLDNFKTINDTFGHHAGDVVLQAISSLVYSLVRKSDCLARYGGEEFVLILPDTSLIDAVTLAEKIRRLTALRRINIGGKAVSVSLSLGVSCLENKGTGSELLREADERLYQAKATGKNRVVPGFIPSFGTRAFQPSKKLIRAV